MTSTREWAAIQYRGAKDFCKRQAPYLILTSFLLCFFLVLFFNRIVISIYPGELGVLWRLLGGGTQIDTVYREGYATSSCRSTGCMSTTSASNSSPTPSTC